MRKVIKKVFIIIILAISVMTISFPFISTIRGKNMSFLNRKKIYLPVSVEKGNFSTLAILDTNMALKTVDQTPIVYRNPNGYDKNVDLILQIRKSSSVDYKDIMVSINENVIKLSDSLYKYDDLYYYFKLGNKFVKAYSKNQDLVRIWLDEDTKILTENSSITFNFLAE